MDHIDNYYETEYDTITGKEISLQIPVGTVKKKVNPFTYDFEAAKIVFARSILRGAPWNLSRLPGPVAVFRDREEVRYDSSIPEAQKNYIFMDQNHKALPEGNVVARESLESAAPDAARRLLGSWLCRRGEGGTVQAGMIVETEAYDQDDPASHSFRGKSARNGAMFGAPGTSYVYIIYGMHSCINVTVGPAGHGAAVLIRAIDPLLGVDTMISRRGSGARRVHKVASGPGNLTKALAITREQDGCDMLSDSSPVWLWEPSAAQKEFEIASGPRVGITKAADVPWRFWIQGNPSVSRFISGVKRKRA